jgi:hypothetical protein
MRESRGGIIAFLDGDDLYHPDRLARSVAVLDAYPEVGSVFHDYRWFVAGSDPEQGRAYLAEERYVERAADALSARPVGGNAVVSPADAPIKFMSTEIVGIHTSAISVRRTVLDALEPRFSRRAAACDIDLWLRSPGPPPGHRPGAPQLTGTRRPLDGHQAASTWCRDRSPSKRHAGRLERMLRPDEWPSYRDRISGTGAASPTSA